MDMDPDLLVPTVGATFGIALMCSAYERSGQDLAYLVDAPTYAGFLARAGLAAHARIFSVEMDEDGPLIDRLRSQIRTARAAISAISASSSAVAIVRGVRGVRSISARRPANSSGGRKAIIALPRAV